MVQNAQAVTIGRNAAGSQRGGAFDAQGTLGVAQGHGDKYGPAYAGRTFFAATAAPVTTSAGLATTYTGLCLSNPTGSGKNLAVQFITGQLVVAPAALTAFGLIVGYAPGGITAHTTPASAGTFGNSLLNGAGPVALIDTACTLVGTPAWYRFLAETPTATSVAAFQADVLGGLLIPPGGYVAFGTDIAGPANGFRASIEWEECPV